MKEKDKNSTVIEKLKIIKDKLENSKLYIFFTTESEYADLYRELSKDALRLYEEDDTEYDPNDLMSFYREYKRENSILFRDTDPYERYDIALDNYLASKEKSQSLTKKNKKL